ncbi:MAG: TraM recognition domain-containing protein, partial [Thermoproteus sp.]
AWWVYQNKVKVLPGVSNNIADYLPNNADLVELLVDQQRLKAALQSLDLSSVPESLKPSVGAARQFLTMPPFGDVWASYGTAISMVISTWSHAIEASHDGAFLALSDRVRKAVGGRLPELDGVYIWLPELGDETRATAAALIHLALDLNFQLRSKAKGGETPLLVLLDDFGAIHYIPALADLPNLGRAVGMWTIVTAQSIRQLAEYGPEKKNLVTAFNTVFAFSVADADTAEYIARRIAVLEPRTGLLDRRPVAEKMASAGRVDASIMDIPAGSAIVITSRPIWKSRNVALIRLYDPRGGGVLRRILRWLKE